MLDYTTSIEDYFNLDYVVIMDNDTIRYTHPNHDLIGLPFEGDNDHYDALKGKTYAHTKPGTMGTSLRAFTPIYNSNPNKSDEIIGAVSLGILLPNLNSYIIQANHLLLISFLISLALAGILALFMALSLKKQMFGMEPKEIAQVLEERNALLKYTINPILITDADGYITYQNQESLKKFTDLSKQHINSLFPDISLSNQSEMIVAQSDTDQSYLISVAPIIVKNKKRGFMFLLRDTLEVIDLIHQLDSTDYFAKRLSEQNHDFLNKLHIIYGLANLEAYGELTNYLEELVTSETNTTQPLELMINNPAISGYLMNNIDSDHIFTSIHIDNEIPSSDSYHQTNQWLRLINKLENIITQSIQPKSCQLNISYKKPLLMTHLIVQCSNQDNYQTLYRDLLIFLSDNSIIIKIKPDNILTIDFSVPYGEDSYDL